MSYRRAPLATSSPLGTRERLAFALLLYTGQRSGDVVKMMRNDIVNGCIRVSQDKARKGTTNELMIPIHPALARALKAGPVVGMQHILTNARGRPLRKLTKFIERAVRAAGLPPHCVAHGLVPIRRASRTRQWPSCRTRTNHDLLTLARLVSFWGLTD